MAFLLVIFGLAGVGAWLLASRVPLAVLDGRNPDIYFSSDTSRVHANMLSRHTNHWRTTVHPLFSLELHYAFQAVAKLTGTTLSEDTLSAGAIKVGRLMSGIAAGTAAALLYALLRLAAVRRLDAFVFCVMAAVSAFGLWWFSVPETYPWGAVTILAALVLVAASVHRQFGAGWYITASVLTLSITTTNWMVGLLATWTRFNLRKTIQWTILALGITVALALVQKALFPSSWLFIKPFRETAYVMQESSGGPKRCLASIFSHTMIMPKVATAPHIHVAGQTVLRTQNSAPGSASSWGLAALGCWTLLLAAGVYALFTLESHKALRMTLGFALLGQIGLHTVYGAETFLYAAHYGPMMIALVALATLTKLRPWVLGLALLLIVCLVLNNFPELQRTHDFLAASQQRLDLLPPTP